MGLKEAFEIYDNCGVKGSSMKSEECKDCPLNKPIYQWQEHPTFCEALNEIDNKFHHPTSFGGDTGIDADFMGGNKDG